ncbi:MAG: FGGY-family carbohydrate kinase [Anaerolineae bacterium]|nr:FGGY-family carbohydrate kinase [Anaerolineae bacterium]
MTLLGVDVGTTHCKAGIFDLSGSPLLIASRSTPTHTTSEGRSYYDPQELWATVGSVIRDVAAAEGIPGQSITAIGVTSMAETGVLLDRQTGAPRSQVLPWFDNSTSAQADWLKSQIAVLDHTLEAGIHPTYKCGLAKLLWLRQNGADFTDGVWLSAADYIVYRLTGEMATDHSLAGRTFAFDIRQRDWDRAWIEHCGFSPDIFPPAQSASTVVGTLSVNDLGMKTGIPVFVAGHDHVCAAFAVGVIEPGVVLNSMGTAETLVGALDNLPAPAQMVQSVLYYGCHVIPHKYFWMGGLNASGGSVEWLRAQLGDHPLSYDELNALLAQVQQIPSGILYFPYLGGSNTMRTKGRARAAFIGLQARHDKRDLLLAVLEGTAYEMESLRRAAEQITGKPIERMIAVGGGVRNQKWMATKANVSGCAYELYPVVEATLLGAALVAGVGAGSFSSVEQAVAAVNCAPAATLLPDEHLHAAYQHLYEEGFLMLQKSLDLYYEKFTL